MDARSTIRVVVLVGLWAAAGCGGEATGPSVAPGAADVGSAGGPDVADAGPGAARSDGGDAGGDADAGPARNDDAPTSQDTEGPADAATAGDGNADAEDAPGPDAAPAGYPSAELLIRILGPSSQEWAQSAAPVIAISGVLFGKPDTLSWAHAETGESGEIAVGAFWSVGGVALKQGTNTVSVTATAGEHVASDTIRVVYNPTFAFGGPLVVDPPALFVGEAATLRASIALTAYANFDPSTVRLHQVGPGGESLAPPAPMSDDGAVGPHCDEVGKDGVHSACLTLQTAEEGCLYLRASVQATAGFQSYEAWSPVTRVCAVPRVTQETCEGVIAAQQEAEAEYLALLEDQSPAEARAALLAGLLARADVAEAGPSAGDTGVWVRYTSGLLGVIDPGAAGLRGASEAPGTTTLGAALAMASGEIGSKDATVLSPSATELGELDESTEVAAVLKAVGCPHFGVRAHQDAGASLFRFRHMGPAGLVAIAGHGGATFGGLSAQARGSLDWDHHGTQEVLWTGEAIDCAKLMKGPSACGAWGAQCEGGAGECLGGGQCIDLTQHDLRRGRVVFGGQTWGIVPDFVAHHAASSPFRDAVVYLGACRSLWNGGFAAAFLGAGAQTVLGFSDAVTSQFAHDRGLSFFTGLIADGRAAGEALGEGGADPVTGGALRLIGSAKATARDAGLVNGSFETGDMTGWTGGGDRRVLHQLGATVPTDGAFMAMVTSGLGTTQEHGTFHQTFCLEAGATSLSFDWKYYSAGLLEWCGSGYQEPFEAALETGGGSVSLLDLGVGALCPPNQCSGCGSGYVGLEPADVELGGGTYTTQWQHAVVALPSPPAVPAVATIRFFLSDAGDTVYDTAVLLDGIRVE